MKVYVVGERSDERTAESSPLGILRTQINPPERNRNRRQNLKVQIGGEVLRHLDVLRDANADPAQAKVDEATALGVTVHSEKRISIDTIEGNALMRAGRATRRADSALAIIEALVSQLKQRLGFLGLSG